MRRVGTVLFFVIIFSNFVYADITTGLIGWWKFDDGSGTSVLDSSGKGSVGDLTGHAPTWTSGLRQGALSFNGTSQYVDLGNPVILEPTTSLSVSAWVYRTGALVSFSGIVSCQKNASNEGGYILAGIATNSVRFYIDKAGNGNWSFAQTDSALPLNQWTHLLGVWDGATVLLYVNGVLQATTGVAGSIGYAAVSQNAYIGRYATDNFPGLIDDVRVYNRALTAQDVYMLYLSDNKISNAVMRNVQFK